MHFLILQDELRVRNRLRGVPLDETEEMLHMNDRREERAGAATEFNHQNQDREGIQVDFGTQV